MLVWINTNTIFCAWKSRTTSKLESMTIPPNHIEFANDNLARIAVSKSDVKIGNEIEVEDGNI